MDKVDQVAAAPGPLACPSFQLFLCPFKLFLSSFERFFCLFHIILIVQMNNSSNEHEINSFELLFISTYTHVVPRAVVQMNNSSDEQ